MKIVRTKRYSKDLKRIGASAAEIAALEAAIAATPTIGDVIPGLGGIRKVRFGYADKGRRGGGRAIYFPMVAEDTAVMVFAYAKSEREDLSNEERKAAMALMKEFFDE